MKKQHLSEFLSEIKNQVRSPHITLNELIQLTKEKGLLVCIMILTIPFLLPISIPGSSTPFGLAILLLCCAILLGGNYPTLPKKIAQFKISTQVIITVFEYAIRIFVKIEKFTKARFKLLTTHKILKLNILIIIYTTLVLMIPMPLPLANTLPAYGIFFTALGVVEKDGLFVAIGYLFSIFPTLYFLALGILGDAIFSKILG